MNILICYMHESEPRMQSYDAMNRGTWIWEFRGLRRNLYPVQKVNGTRISRDGGIWFGHGRVWMKGVVDLVHLLRIRPARDELR